MLNKELFLQHHPLNILGRSTCAPEVPALSVAFCGFRAFATYVQVNALVTDTCRQMSNEILVTFIDQLMHSIITVIDVKILSYKSLKDTH